MNGFKMNRYLTGNEPAGQDGNRSDRDDDTHPHTTPGAQRPHQHRIEMQVACGAAGAGRQAKEEDWEGPGSHHSRLPEPSP